VRRPVRLLLVLPAGLLGVLVGAGVANERGDAVGLPAAAFYAGLFAIGVLRWDELVAWGKRHPVADRAVMAPLMFFTLALLTELPLLACAGLGVLAAVLLVVVDALRRRGRPNAPAAP
jgi:hypothetical protein